MVLPDSIPVGISPEGNYQLRTVPRLVSYFRFVYAISMNFTSAGWPSYFM